MAPDNDNLQSEFNSIILKKLSQLNHDLRSPFATMQSLLNIMEMEDYNISREDLKEMAESLKVSVSNAIQNIDAKVLELSSILKSS